MEKKKTKIPEAYLNMQKSKLCMRTIIHPSCIKIPSRENGLQLHAISTSSKFNCLRSLNQYIRLQARHCISLSQTAFTQNTSQLRLSPVQMISIIEKDCFLKHF